jgi:very-short-patch-repair endonuclease
MKSLARELRRESTDAEKWLWQRLRNREVLGFKFRRQHPIGPYIVDVVCIEKRITIELDGSQHIENVKADDERSEYLKKEGYQVLRFWNNDVLVEGEARPSPPEGARER